MESHKLQVTFVVIPGELAFNPDLSYQDMFVFWMVNSLNGKVKGRQRVCTASNYFISEKLGTTTRHIQKSIATLVNEGYLKRKVVGENKRELTVDYRYQKEKAECITRYNECGKGVRQKRRGGTSKMPPDKYSKLRKVFKLTTSSQCLNKSSNQKPLRRVYKKRKKNVANTERKIQKIFTLWNSLGKPFTKHKFDRRAKVTRRAKKYIVELFNKGVSTRKIIQAIRDWHSFMHENGTMFSGLVFTNAYTSIFNNQLLPNFFRPDLYTMERYKKVLPDIEIIIPYVEAKRGFDYLKKKYKKVDGYARFTKLMAGRWYNRHKEGDVAHLVELSKRFVKKYGKGHLTSAEKLIDDLNYVIDQVPDNYTSKYLVSAHFWDEFLPEKMKEFNRQ